MAFSIFTNGGSRGNLGPYVTTWVIYNQSKNLLLFANLFLPRVTNNKIEYSIIVGVLFGISQSYYGPIFI